jgi:RNA polymerase sigma-70 factor (ECF subfamily)
MTELNRESLDPQGGATYAHASEDAAAIAAFQAGDREAFSQLVARHHPRIFALALRLCRSVDDAMDLTQDTFARALDRLGTLSEPRYFGSWLYRIAINHGISHQRRQDRAPALDPHQLADLVQPSGREAGDPAVVQERSAAIQAALATLPQAQRAAVVLCDLEGHSYEAIARLLDISIGTVMSRIHYGRKKLRTQLEPWLR